MRTVVVLSEGLAALVTIAEAEAAVLEGTVWFLVQLAKAKNKPKAFLPAAERASARIARKLTLKAAKKLR